MATLSLTKTYADNTLLSAADLDAILDDLETFLNDTGLNDDNIEAAGITASSKIKSASITETILGTDSVTTAKIADEAVTVSKVLDANVTTAKIQAEGLTEENFADTVGLAFAGFVTEFHSFNGLLSVPRGWMKCDGSLLSETTYDALHGAGAYETDGIADSDLLGKYLPDMDAKYVLGAATTTETGASAIATTGNSGNTINVAHTHNIAEHEHSLFLSDANGGTGTPVGYGTFAQTPNTDNIVDESVASALSSTQDIRPESIEFIYIMKVI